MLAVGYVMVSDVVDPELYENHLYHYASLSYIATRSCVHCN